MLNSYGSTWLAFVRFILGQFSTLVRWLGFGHLPFPCHYANSRVIVPV